MPHAFTLIELLVVISIIALLIAVDSRDLFWVQEHLGTHQNEASLLPDANDDDSWLIRQRLPRTSAWYKTGAVVPRNFAGCCVYFQSKCYSDALYTF